jgi:tripartite-type tricarboxylate transporter receptor subunit TctC
MAWVQANPQKANFGVPAPGSLPYFFALMLGEAAKIQPLVVPCNGSAPLLNDLLGGQIPLALDSPDSVEPYHRAGKLRILAVSSAKRLSFLPDVPTFQELGVNIVATAWNAFFAPKSMPLGKVDRISNAIQEVMKDPDTQKRFTDANLVPVVSNRAQTEAMVQAFREQWTPVIQNSGYKP